MTFIRNVALIALMAGAYATNPEESSFRIYIEDEMKRNDKQSSWLERKVVTHVMSRMYEREDYYIFSLVRVPEDRLTFVGVFGHWFHLPIPKPKLR